jgi:hypothetical protein
MQDPTQAPVAPVAPAAQSPTAGKPKKAIVLESGQDPKQVAITLADLITQAEQQRSSYLRTIAAGRTYLNTQRKRTSRPWKGASEITMPMVISVRNRLAAQINDVLFSIHPLFNVEGQREEDDALAPWVEQFLEGLFTRVCPLDEALEPVLLSSLDDGVGVAHITWRREMRQITRHTNDEATGAWSQRPGEDLEYDGPDIEYVPIDRFGIYPSVARDVQRSRGIWFKVSRTGDELVRLRNEGFIDKAALQALQDTQGEAEHLKSAESDQRGMRYSGGELDFVSRPYDIHICYWRLPGKKDDDPAVDHYLWLHVPTQTILHAERNPRWSGRRPAVIIRPFPDKETIYGESLPNLLADLEDTMTTIVRQVIDQAAVDIATPVAVEDGAITPEQEKNLVYGPGQIWRVTRVDGIKLLAKPSQIQVGLQAAEFCKEIVNRLVGTSDQTFGMEPSRAQTATTTQVLASNQSVLFGLIVNRLRRGLSQVAAHVLDLSYEYAGNEAVSMIWRKLVGSKPNPFAGQAPTTDNGVMEDGAAPVPEQGNLPAGALPVEAGMGTERPDRVTMLGGRYWFNAAGSTETNNKELKRAIMREVYERLMVNPLIAYNPLRIYALTRRYLTELGIRVPEELLGKEVEVRQALQTQGRAMVDNLSADEQQKLANQGEEVYASEQEAIPGAIQGAFADIFAAAPGAPQG